MRRQSINFKLIFRIIGILLLMEGFAMLSSIAFSAYYHPDSLQDIHLFKATSDFYPILISSFITAISGLIFVLFTGKAQKANTSKKEAYLVVSFSWVIISLFGSLPFYLSGYFSNYTDAFFETISGFTTTGASILSNIESLPKGLLFWRSLTQWIGGMGIIVLSLAILPLLGIGGMQLFSAEAPGPTADKIHPKVREMAKRLWGIYILLTIAQFALLSLGEMSYYDALCHAFTTMATGGFSTQNDSIAGFSNYSQYIIVLFMIFAGTSFSLHYFLLKGKLTRIIKNEEFQLYLAIIVIASIVIATGLYFTGFSGFEASFRLGIFQVVSILTTTGFVTSDYLLWHNGLWIVLLLLFFVGGSAGSTGGGVKVIRILILIKNSVLEFRRLIHPHAIIPVRLNTRPVAESIVFVVISFFLFYVIIFAFGVIFLVFAGLDFVSAIGASASSIGNIGPGLGTVGPVENYAQIPIMGKWVLSFLMLLGRLELFTILIIFSPSFWKK
jgi:trk system potassium uptake protein TrkH